MTVLSVFCNDAVKASLFGAEPLLKMFGAGDASVVGVALFIAFLGAHRTLGNFTFKQAMLDMEEDAKNNPQSYDWSSSSTRTGTGTGTGTSMNGEVGPVGGVDSRGQPFM